MDGLIILEIRQKSFFQDLNVNGDPEAKVMRKMFIYNLPEETQNKDLKDYYETYGEIEVCEYNVALVH